MSWLLPYLIVCPLVGLAGFIDAIAGGGGLISLPAYILSGLPPHAAIGTNKFSSFCGTTLTTYRFARKGMFSIRRSVPAIIAAMVGSYIGAELAMLIPDRAFEIVLMVIIPLTAILILSHKDLASHKQPYSPALTMWLATIIAFVIGIYDGIYGPGTGTFLIILLVYLARMSLNESAGVTKIINLSTNAAALVVFISSGVVVFPLAIVAAIFGIAGNYLGSAAFITNGQRIVRPIIIVVMALLLGKILWQLL